MGTVLIAMPPTTTGMSALLVKLIRHRLRELDPADVNAALAQGYGLPSSDDRGLQRWAIAREFGQESGMVRRPFLLRDSRDPTRTCWMGKTHGMATLWETPVRDVRAIAIQECGSLVALLGSLPPDAWMTPTPVRQPPGPPAFSPTLAQSGDRHAHRDPSTALGNDTR